MEGTRLVLLRHGESVAQVEEIVGGHTGCRGLSDLGRFQVELLAERLRSTGELGRIAAVYTSLMPRAVETAEIVAGALAPAWLDDAEVVPECAFCEMHPGDEVDGLTWEELRRRFPPSADGRDPDGRVAPGAETWDEMAGRVAGGLDRLVERHAGETVVIGCHGGVVLHTMARWLGLPPIPTDGEQAWFRPDNASITEWRYGPVPFRSGVEGWQLVRFNDSAHLASVPEHDPAGSPGR